MFASLSAAFKGLVEQGSVAAVGVAFLIGLIVGFTPCVYPVLPLTVAYIGRMARGSRRRGLAYSLLYVLGMALVYVALAVVFVTAGRLFGSLWSNGWFLLALGLLFLVLALWMFGVVRLPTPRFFQSGGRAGAAGAIAVGAAAGLVVGPCQTPALSVLFPLIARSSESGAAGGLVFGIVVMFAYSLGMGSLIVLCGTFSGFLANLPKAGAWTAAIEKAFAVLMLLVAVFFIVCAGQTGNLPDLLAYMLSFGR